MPRSKRCWEDSVPQTCPRGSSRRSKLLRRLRLLGRHLLGKERRSRWRVMRFASRNRRRWWRRPCLLPRRQPSHPRNLQYLQNCQHRRNCPLSYNCLCQSRRAAWELEQAVRETMQRRPIPVWWRHCLLGSSAAWDFWPMSCRSILNARKWRRDRRSRPSRKWRRRSRDPSSTSSQVERRRRAVVVAGLPSASGPRTRGLRDVRPRIELAIWRARASAPRLNRILSRRLPAPITRHNPRPRLLTPELQTRSRPTPRQPLALQATRPSTTSNSSRG